MLVYQEVSHQDYLLFPPVSPTEYTPSPPGKCLENDKVLLIVPSRNTSIF